MQSSTHRYGRWQIGVHWLTVTLVAVAYVLIEWHGLLPKGSDARALAKTWHEMVGLSVFWLTFMRLGLRLARPAPPIDPPLPSWQHRLARAVHALLYAWLFAMPLLGWLYLSAKGAAIPFFGFEFPALISQDADWAGTIKSVHEFLGNAGYALIGGHALVALHHHYIVHDNTLARMLPARSK